MLYIHVRTYVAYVIITADRILYGEKKYSSTHTFRRPYGCAGVYIADLLY